MIRRLAFPFAIALIVLALVNGLSLRLFPDSAIAQTVLPYPVGTALLVVIGLVGLAPVTVSAFAFFLVALAVFRRRLVYRSLRLFVLIHWLAGGFLLVQVAVLFYPLLFASTALAFVVVAVVFAVVRKRPASRLVRLVFHAVIAAAALSPALTKLGEMPVSELRAEWDAVRYFPPSNAYDVAIGEGDDRYVAVGYGGGLFRVRGTDFPGAITAAATDLAKAKKIAVCGGRIYVTNNAADRPAVADAASFAWPDLSDRRDIFLADYDRVAGVVCDERSRRLFFIDEKNPRLAAWDIAGESLTAGVMMEPRIHVGEMVLDEESRRVYVTSWFRGHGVFSIDADRLELAAVPEVGASVSDVAIDRDRGVVYLARPLHRRVDVYDPDSWTRTGSIRTIPLVRNILLLDGGDRLAVGSYLTGELEVIDLRNPEIRVRIKAFPRIRELTLDAGRDELLVSSMRGVWGIPLSIVRERMAGGR